MIHEDFYCNRRYADATNLTAGGLAPQDDLNGQPRCS